MAESLTDYLIDSGIKAVYVHSDVDTLERIEIIRDLRLGKYDVLVGINLLREGLDIPECALIAILDADKEGFLRSETALVQTIGRAARNADGKVILYADKITKSIQKAMSETQRRRNLQQEHNKKHGIVPKTIVKSIKNMVDSIDSTGKETEIVDEIQNSDKVLKKLRKEMLDAASNMEFEEAAKLRDKIMKIEENLIFNS